MKTIKILSFLGLVVLVMSLLSTTPQRPVDSVVEVKRETHQK